MSGFSSTNEDDSFWNPQNDPTMISNASYNADYTSFQNQQFELDFQAFGDGSQQQKYEYYPQTTSYDTTSFMYSETNEFSSEYDEPPLLEELEIYPDRIIEKIVAVLNPLRGHSLADDSDFLIKGSDLAGPVLFCIILALCLFLSGSKVYFGYIYGLSVMSCLLMYSLLSLMTSANQVFTLSDVCSSLGYSLLPIVVLSVLGVFVSYNGVVGIIVTVLAILWSSLSASRLFVAMSGDAAQQPLIAYSCALIYGVFTLLVIF